MRHNHLSSSSWLLCVAAATVINTLPAQAAGVFLVVSIAPVAAPVGAMGSGFDVNIQNTGSNSQNIAAFSIGVSVPDPHVSFTGGNFATSLLYLFSGDSFDANNGFPLTILPPPGSQLVEASDLSDSLIGTDLAGGATMALGRIVFKISSGASIGPVPLLLAPDCVTVGSCTGFTDSLGNDVPFSVSSGTLTVTPEPNPALLLLGAIGALSCIRRRSV